MVIPVYQTLQILCVLLEYSHLSADIVFNMIKIVFLKIFEGLFGVYLFIYMYYLHVFAIYKFYGAYG